MRVCGERREEVGSSRKGRKRRGGGRGGGKTQSRWLLQSLRGQRESAAPVARSLLSSPILSSLSRSPSPYAHTRAGDGAHAHTHGAAACNSARTPRCRNRGYSRPRKRESPNRLSSPPLYFTIRASSSSPFARPLDPYSLAFASSTLLLVG